MFLFFRFRSFTLPFFVLPAYTNVMVNASFIVFFDNKSRQKYKKIKKITYNPTLTYSIIRVCEFIFIFCCYNKACNRYKKIRNKTKKHPYLTRRYRYLLDKMVRALHRHILTYSRVYNIHIYFTPILPL